MKKRLIHSTLALVGFLLMSAGIPKDAPKGDCKAVLALLNRANMEFAQSTSFYLEYTCTNVFDGVSAKPMHAKYWKEGNKMQFLSEPVSMYCDGKTLVRVMDPIQVVVVQNALRQSAAPVANVDPQAGIDSLWATACGVNCLQSGGTGKISFDFLPQRGKLVPYRSVMIAYDLQSGNITQADYTYFPDLDGVVQEDRYVFLKRIAGHANGMFANTAEGQVMDGKGLKPQYSHYEIQDLRTLASNFSK